MVKLVCVRGNNKGDQFPIEEGETVIGRVADCRISLFDKHASRHHCRVVRHSDSISIEDIGSRHGTRVNGETITGKTILDEGDKIKIGHTTLVLTRKTVGSKLDEALADMEERSKADRPEPAIKGKRIILERRGI